MARFILTERLDKEEPGSKDPLAQAMPKHSNVFDMRDADDNNKVLMHGWYNLKWMRYLQAKWNTREALD